MTMTEKQWNIIKKILLFFSVCAALKMIFFDYTMDEEYQIVMAYRSISGDSLFVEMWEPHQTSAFLCAILMRLYYAVTDTWTCVILYLRVCTTLIQIAVSMYLYRVLCHLTQRRYAFLLALAWFNVVPKNIQIPEFSNMQLWFFTLTVLLLMQYGFCDQGVTLLQNTAANKQEKELSAGPGTGRSVLLLVLAGICMSLEVLSYPSCIVLFPFFLIFIFRKSKGHRWRDCGMFAATCMVCALIWFLQVLHQINLSDFIRNVGYVLDFDVTHVLSGATQGKVSGLFSNLAAGLGLIALIMAVSAGVLCFLRRRALKRKERPWTKSETILLSCVIAVLVSEPVQLFYWVILRQGFEMNHIHFVVIYLAGAFAWRYAGGKNHILAVGIFGSLLVIAAVFYISDLELYNAIPQGILGVLFCILILVWALERQPAERMHRWIGILLVSLCLTCLVGKGFTMRGGRDYNSVLGTQNIMKYGPAAGILTDYMNAYIYNCNYEDFKAYIRDGDRVLIVANMVKSESTTAYLFRDVEICHYSVVDPTAYDERLLIYWDLYPEKMPDVIVVDCWYGTLMEDEDSWMMQFIRNEFDYTSVTDGRYIRIYRKDG